jgi:hypothetical protein
MPSLVIPSAPQKCRVRGGDLQERIDRSGHHSRLGEDILGEDPGPYTRRSHLPLETKVLIAGAELGSARLRFDSFHQKNGLKLEMLFYFHGSPVRRRERWADWIAS